MKYKQLLADAEKEMKRTMPGGRTSNIDMENSGGSRMDAPVIRDFGVQKRGRKIQFTTPIQPVYKDDPRYKNLPIEPKKNYRYNRKVV